MFNKKDFLQRRSDILDYFNKKEITEDNIAEYCSLSGIPIIIVCEFILEEHPEHRRMCLNKMNQIREFFGVQKSCGTCVNFCGEEHCITRKEND